MKINLCNAEWTIKEVDKVEITKLNEGSDVDGLTVWDTQTIYINAERHEHRRNLTLVHELLHVIYDYVGIEDDEQLVRQIEHHVYELIHKYPKKYKEDLK